MRPPLSEPPAPRPKVIVVGGGPFQLDIVRTARELGALVAVADRDAGAPGLAIADHPLAIDIVDLDAMVAAAKAWGADGVVTAASDVALPAVAAIGEALGLRALDVRAVERCRDKYAMFEAVRDAGLRVPTTVAVSSDAEAEQAARDVGGFPVVVKPRSAAGGRGVSVVRDRSSLWPAIERARKYDRVGQRECLLQTFVGGHALGVEAFFWDNELAATFLMDDQFVEGFVSPVGHSLPSELGEDEHEEVRAAVLRYAEVLGLSEGPANFDLRFDQDGCVLLEVNARLGGNSITDLVRATYGVDLSGATVRACLGQDPRLELEPTRLAPTASRLLLVRGEGRAAVDAPFAGVTDREGVLAIELTVADDAPFSMRVDEHAIVGRCIVSGSTPAEAAARAARVASEVRVGARR